MEKHPPSPTFTDPKGDVFFVTTPNKVVFQVSTAFLSHASAVFEGMFQAPVPPGNSEGSEDAPIQLDVEDRTFDAVLRLIYPGRNPTLHTDLPLLVKCARFADKYSMEEALSTIRDALLHPAILAERPFRAYSIACHFGWTEEMKLALQATLPHSVQELEDVPELEFMNGKHYREVVRAHRAKLEKLLCIVEDLTRWRFQRRGDVIHGSANEMEVVRHWWHRQRCKCNPSTTGSHSDGTFDSAPPKWLLTFQDDARTFLETFPTAKMAAHVFDVTRIASMASEGDCDGCVHNAVAHMSELQGFKRRIDDVFAHLDTV